jgi:hypothetical protein
MLTVFCPSSSVHASRQRPIAAPLPQPGALPRSSIRFAEDLALLGHYRFVQPVRLS